MYLQKCQIFCGQGEQVTSMYNKAYWCKMVFLTDYRPQDALLLRSYDHTAWFLIT
jgi:hypothetical protein